LTSKHAVKYLALLEINKNYETVKNNIAQKAFLGL